MIDKLLSATQINEIVRVIKEQCKGFRVFKQKQNDLFYEPYTHMRHKYTVTSAVISGFAPGRNNIDGITCEDLNYGLNDNLIQPELTCENGVFHIYSNGSDLKGKKIIERCREMNADLSTTPVFFMIIVHVTKEGILNKIEIRLPDINNNTICKKTIYEESKVIELTA